MIMNSRGKRLWIVDETGQVQPVGSYKDITGKARGRNLPDWWVEERDPDWTPPPPTSLLSLSAANVGHVEAGAGGGAGGMKIGAGHKPQPYDEHGRYTGPNGASISMDGGIIRTFSADSEGAKEWRMNGQEDGGQEDASAQDAEQRVEEKAGEMQRAAEELEAVRQQAQGSGTGLDGVLLADSGQIRSDAGGLSGGTEVRGPVAKPGATVTWKNDEPGKLNPNSEELQPHMRETVENLRKDNPALDSFNVNSGSREPMARHDPHAEGRAVDINRINDVKASELADPKTPEAVRAREAADIMEQNARKDPNVNQFIGPNGGWRKDEKGRVTPMSPVLDKDLLNDHKNHFHVNVFRTPPKR